MVPRIVFLSLFLISTTLQAASMLNFPLISVGEGSITGLALSNTGSTPIDVRLTAFRADGRIVRGNSIQNPVDVSIAPGNQHARLLTELFGAGTGSMEGTWFQAVSESDSLAAFFLYLDGSVRYLDGADAVSTSINLLFTEIRIGEEYSTELTLINPNNVWAAASLRLEGNPQEPFRMLRIAPMGTAHLNASDLIDTGSASETAVVAVSCRVPLGGFALIKAPGDYLGVKAVPDRTGLDTNFFPQLAVLDPFASQVLVTNRNSRENTVAISAYQPDGKPFPPSVAGRASAELRLGPSEVSRFDLEELLEFSGQGPRDGWLRMEGELPGIQGSLTYEIPMSGSRAAVPSAEATQSGVFSHIATSFGYFTGVAVLNAASSAANIEIAATTPEGNVLGSFQGVLRPGERWSRLIEELIPETAGQSGGAIWVRSDRPVYMLSLFGNSRFGVLANIPIQSPAGEFSFPQDIPALSLAPLSTALAAGGSVPFQLSPAGGPGDWAVDGVPGGNEQVGTISPVGRYTAPARSQARTVVVTARRGEATAGATIQLTQREENPTGLGGSRVLAASQVSEAIFVGSGGSIRRIDGTGAHEVKSFGSDTVQDLTVFSSINGAEFLLAGLGSGTIVRIDPVSGQTTDLVTGLVDIASLEVDPFSGNLLVGERTFIGLVPRMTLNKGLSGISQSQLNREILHSSTQASDLVTDRCTGDLYFAEPGTGSIKRIDYQKRKRSVALGNLSDPTRVLAVYRKGVPCPSALELLIFEQGNRTLSVWAPSLGTISLVAANLNLTGIILKTTGFRGSRPAEFWISDSSGKLSSLDIGAAYSRHPVNPPPIESTPDLPVIRSVSAVAPNILAIEIDERGVIEARQISYEAQPGDRIEETGNHGYGTVWLRRNGKIIGALAGKNRDLLYTFDQFQGHQLDPTKADKRELYWLTSPDDPNLGLGKHPTSLGRKSKPLEMVQTDTWSFLWPLRHTIYLRLPQDLKDGSLYRIHSDALPVPLVEYRHRPDRNISEALHISHLGFRPDDTAKTAFLSCWMGDAGGLSYAAESPFKLFDQDDQVVFEGRTTLAKAGADKTEDPYNRNYNRTDVHQLDFTALNREGLYRACVEGIGCTYPFPISPESWARAFSTSAQGLYHQRSGIELSPSYTTFHRPRPFHPDDGMVILHSTAPLMDTGNGLNSSDDGNFGNLVAGMTDTPVSDAWGGYFDAGDWDRRIQHLDAARLLLELADLFPEFVQETRLEIPESDDGLPDVLNEALWGLDLFRRMQTPAGGIRGGIESAEHPRRGEASWQESLPVMAYAPGVWSSFVYAGVAARAAHVLEGSDSTLAQVYSDSALRAMEWAETEYPKLTQSYPHAVKDSRNLAAAELYRLTGLSRWHQIFLNTTAFTNGNNNLAVWQQHEQRDAAFVYLRTNHPGVNQTVWGNAYNALMREAQGSVAQAKKTGFRWTKMDTWEPVGWGKLSTPAATNLLRAHFLTGKESYLTTAILACQTGSGANPVNISYTTWTGYDTPQHPLIVDQKVTAQGVPPGITIYGPFDLERPENSGYFTMQLIRDFLHPRMEDWPTIEAYFDLYLFPAVTEFTVMQNLAPTLYAWGYLAARASNSN